MRKVAWAPLNSLPENAGRKEVGGEQGEKQLPGSRAGQPASRKRTRSPGWCRAATRRAAGEWEPGAGGGEWGPGPGVRRGWASGLGRLGPSGATGRAPRGHCEPAPPGGPRRGSPSLSPGAGAASGRSAQTQRPRGPGRPLLAAPSRGKGRDAPNATETSPSGPRRTRASGQNCGLPSMSPLLGRVTGTAEAQFLNARALKGHGDPLHPDAVRTAPPASSPGSGALAPVLS